MDKCIAFVTSHNTLIQIIPSLPFLQLELPGICRTLRGLCLKTIVHIFDSVNLWVGKLVSFLLIPIILLMVYDTMMRYVFNNPTIWGGDTVRLVSGFYFLLGAGYVLLYRGHVNMDVIFNRFSIRVQAILNLLTALIFFLFCYILLHYGVIFGWRALVAREVTMAPSFLPVYPTKMILPVGAFLLIIQGISNFIRDFSTAISGRRCEY